MEKYCIEFFLFDVRVNFIWTRIIRTFYDLVSPLHASIGASETFQKKGVVSHIATGQKRQRLILPLSSIFHSVKGQKNPSTCATIPSSDLMQYTLSFYGVPGSLAHAFFLRACVALFFIHHIVMIELTINKKKKYLFYIQVTVNILSAITLKLQLTLYRLITGYNREFFRWGVCKCHIRVRLSFLFISIFVR